MTLRVQKFGGSSVATVEKIKFVAQKVAEAAKAGDQVVVVVSAMGKTTDQLTGLAKEITHQPDPREMDLLLSTGEEVSISLLSMALQAEGVKAASVSAPEMGICTDDNFTRARIESIEPDTMHDLLNSGHVVVAPGFQGQCKSGRITTFGRGGSDKTAVVLAHSLKADVCEIFTDVDGVYTADPRVVPDARHLEKISYDEMLELATTGAKVMQSDAVEWGKKHNVIMRVAKTQDGPQGKGTIISEEGMAIGEGLDGPVVTGCAVNVTEARISVKNIPDECGKLGKIFAALSENRIDVDMIVLNVPQKGLCDLSFTVLRDDAGKAKEVTEKISQEIGAGELEVDDTIAKLSIVGVGMQNHFGVAHTMFKALGDANINIDVVTTSEIKISVLIEEAAKEEALKAVHAAFNLGAQTVAS